jgi:hypothetical protein
MWDNNSLSESEFFISLSLRTKTFQCFFFYILFLTNRISLCMFILTKSIYIIVDTTESCIITLNALGFILCSACCLFIFNIECALLQFIVKCSDNSVKLPTCVQIMFSLLIRGGLFSLSFQVTTSGFVVLGKFLLRTETEKATKDQEILKRK